jgi:von Willebrand factor type A domain/Aerotolerance regulator N-terminal
MTWGALPLAGVVAAVAVPLLILLYFLKLRRSPRPIPSTLLWRKTIEDLRANAPFQKLRRNLLLFLQLLVLLLIVLAIAKPGVRAESEMPERVVIMIDRSRSMNVVDSGEEQSRFELAKEQAIEFIRSLPEPSVFSKARGKKPTLAMVVSFAEQAELVSNFVADKGQLVTRIRSIQPTDGRTKIGEALTLSRAYNRSVEDETRGQLLEDPPTIELYTDGNIRDVAEQTLEGETVNLHQVGSVETFDNLAVSAMEATRLYDRPSDLSVFTTLANFSPSEVASEVQLSLNGTPIQLLAIRLPAASVDEESGEFIPGTRGITFTVPKLITGGTLEARLLRDDVLASDNVGLLIIPPPKVARVGYVSNSPFLRQALAGLPIDVEALTIEEVNAAILEGRTGSHDVIILDGVMPEAKLQVGRFLTFGPPPVIDGILSEGVRNEAMYPSDWDRRHPATRNVQLDDVLLSRYHALTLPDDAQPIIEGVSAPLAVSITRGDLQAIVATFRPLDSTWPLQPSYVIFLADAVRYLANRGQSATAESVEPGSVINVRLPSQAENIRLSLPKQGRGVNYSAQDAGAISFGPVERVGLHRFTYRVDGQEQERLVAANLFDAEESRVQARSELTMMREEVTAQQQQGTRAGLRALWPWALIAALALMMFEWWVYNRKAYL